MLRDTAADALKGRSQVSEDPPKALEGEGGGGGGGGGGSKTPCTIKKFRYEFPVAQTQTVFLGVNYK